MDNKVFFLPGENFPEGIAVPQREEIVGLLNRYGIDAAGVIRLIDTTHDETDIRLNYIIGKKWVLRFCNTPDMTEKRLADLSRLTERYRAAIYH